jgi:hypothetical protein
VEVVWFRMLFHGLTSDDTDVAQPSFQDGMSVDRITDMKGVVEMAKVRLRKGENGEWNLVVLDQSESN